MHSKPRCFPLKKNTVMVSRLSCWCHCPQQHTGSQPPEKVSHSQAAAHGYSRMAMHLPQFNKGLPEIVEPELPPLVISPCLTFRKVCLFCVHASNICPCLSLSQLLHLKGCVYSQSSLLSRSTFLPWVHSDFFCTPDLVTGCPH